MRNLLFLAGLNDEIGVMKSLNQMLPNLIKSKDFDQNTALSVCYLEMKSRSVRCLLSLGC